MEGVNPAALEPAHRRMRELARTLGAMEGALCSAISQAEHADELVRELKMAYRPAEVDRSLTGALHVWSDTGSNLGALRDLAGQVRHIWDVIYPYYGAETR